MQHAGIVRPRSLIVAHVLLLLAERPRHGYELAESLRAWEFEGVTTSTMYRELARLEQEGLVRSFWQASQARGPARHMYELTPGGRDDLASCADDIRGLIGHLNEFLSRFVTVQPAVDVPREEPIEEASATPRRRFWRAQ